MVVEANLPSGVIRNNTEAVSGDIEKIDTLTVEELAKLWRAYSTKQKLLANDVGRRLENFFWRIWSNEHVRTTIRGNQIALIFGDISQGHIIRTTPTSSPRNSRLYAAAHRARQTRNISPHPPQIEQASSSRAGRQRPHPQQLGSSDTIVPRKTSDASERQRERSRPPPILKKPGADYGTSNKTARIQTPGWKSSEADPEHDEPMSPAEYEATRRTTSPRFQLQEEDDLVVDDAELSPTIILAPSPTTAQPPVQSEKMARTGSGQGSSSGLRGKKKPSFVASSARKRPVMGRRPSSQVSGSNATKITSPTLRATRRPSEEGHGSTMTRTQSSLTSADSKVASLELCVSRSHSPVSESPFRRTGKDHEALDRTKTPETLHREAAGLLAPRSQWLSLQDSGLASSDMKRTTSASGAALSTTLPKAALASVSSSNLQIAGTMTPTDSASATPARQSILGRATSLFKGKGKATFDIGPPETDSADVSRRTSIEVGSETRPLGAQSFSHSRSQSQLSGLLDQERRKGANRDRNKSTGEQSGPGRR